MGKAQLWLWFLLAVVAGCWLGYSLLNHAGPPPARGGRAPAVAVRALTPAASPAPLGAVVSGSACSAGPAAAAEVNQSGMRALAIAAFHRAESGWAIYAPMTAHEIGVDCDGGSPAFAGRLARWQAAHGLSVTGIMDGTTMAALKAAWDARRPFEIASRRGCPAPPDPARLTPVPAALSYGGKAMLLRPGALAAFERLRTAARAALPQIRSDPRLMSLFSAFRAPADDAARCAREGNCGGVTRASCSAHRTGLAMDIYLGAAPGFDPASSDDANRLYISQGPAYRWMVANAGRFGFVNYPFEPWHWEWTGEPI